MSRFGTIRIQGNVYDLDDMLLDEVEEIEDHCGGVAFSDLNFGSAKTMKAVAFVLMRRNNPDLQWEEVGKVRMIDFVPPDEESPSPPADAGEAKDGSEPADSGVHLSAVSTAG